MEATATATLDLIGAIGREDLGDLYRLVFEEGNRPDATIGDFKDGMNALRLAAVGHPESLALLLTYPSVDVDVPDAGGRSPLFWSVRFRGKPRQGALRAAFRRCAELLLIRGANPLHRTRSGMPIAPLDGDRKMRHLLTAYGWRERPEIKKYAVSAPAKKDELHLTRLFGAEGLVITAAGKKHIRGLPLPELEAFWEGRAEIWLTDQEAEAARRRLREARFDSAVLAECPADAE